MGSSKTDQFPPNTLVYEMATLVNICGLCLWLYLVSKNPRTVVSQTPLVVEGSLSVDGSASVASTDDDLICATVDWWPPEKCDYGTCSWGQASLLNLDLSNKILLNAVKAFSPLKIRLGGTLEDKVVYQSLDNQIACNQFVKSSTEMFGFTEGCLPLLRWDELNNFFKMAGAKVIFGLNALNGRTIGSDGSATGPWNSSNAESLMRYTVEQNYTIYGWELGNELSGNGIGASVAVDQYALDVIKLQNIVQDVYRGFQIKPLVLGPGGFLMLVGSQNFLAKHPTLFKSLLTIYTTLVQHCDNIPKWKTSLVYVGVDDHLVDKILDPSYLDGGSRPFNDLQSILKNSGTSTTAWVGEAGGAYNSGRNLVTNRFVFSFWYLDQLGMASSYGTKTYCRQTLIGGNYGLLNTTTFVPNPDYYSALIWHRLMGRNVLATNVKAITKLRAYAHCSKNSPGITVLLLNLDSNTTVQVDLSVANAVLKNTSTLQLHNHSRKGKFARYNVGRTMREEYHLTPKDGDIHSQTVLLNGKILAVDSSGRIPPLEPKRVYPSNRITIAPFSVVFADIPTILVPACK